MFYYCDQLMNIEDYISCSQLKTCSRLSYQRISVLFLWGMSCTGKPELAYGGSNTFMARQRIFRTDAVNRYMQKQSGHR